MTHRALELLNLPPGEPKFLLDIGCGSGLSGEILEEEGHVWVGVDIAPSMLGKSYLLQCTFLPPDLIWNFFFFLLSVTLMYTKRWH